MPKLIGPPVYRPTNALPLLRKSAVPAMPRLIGPPVYRPQPPKTSPQPKSRGIGLPGNPPPVYNPSQSPQRIQPRLSVPVGGGSSSRVEFPPRPANVVQRVTDCGGGGSAHHIAFGNFLKSDAKLEFEKKPPFPIIIELLEPNPKSAKAKIEQVIKSKMHQRLPVAFVIAINAKIGDKYDTIDEYPGKLINSKLGELQEHCTTLTQMMEDAGIAGGCFPLVWAPTSTKLGGYTFPFLECRSILTLHGGVEAVHLQMREFGNPVVRGMDSDVRMDPLLTGSSSHPLSVDKKTMIKDLTKGLSGISEGTIAVFSGGYEWDVDGVNDEKLEGLGLEVPESVLNLLKALVAIVNIHENEVREALAKLSFKSVYWPEPNVYMSLDLRMAGARQSMETARSLKKDEAQQKESTQYVGSELAYSGKFLSTVSTRKPLKTYFDEFLKYFADAIAKNKTPSLTDIETQVKAIRQTHLDIQKVSDIMKWHGIVDSYTLGLLEPIIQTGLRDCAEAISAVINPIPYHQFRPPVREISLSEVTLKETPEFTDFM
jgi:hypothetical protein